MTSGFDVNTALNEKAPDHAADVRDQRHRPKEVPRSLSPERIPAPRGTNVGRRTGLEGNHRMRNPFGIFEKIITLLQTNNSRIILVEQNTSRKLVTIIG
jgi:hypothetical protein